MTDAPLSPCCDAPLEPRASSAPEARCGQVYLRNGRPGGGWSYPRFDPDGRACSRRAKKPRPISTGAEHDQ